MDKSGIMDFIDKLPRRLRVEMTALIHNTTIIKIPFFKGRSKEFIAFVGPMLKAAKFKEDEIIFNSRRNLGLVSFISSGVVGYIIKEFEDRVYCTAETGDIFGHLEICQLFDYED